MRTLCFALCLAAFLASPAVAGECRYGTGVYTEGAVFEGQECACGDDGDCRWRPAAAAPQQAATPETPSAQTFSPPPGTRCAEWKGRLGENDWRWCWWETAEPSGCHIWKWVSAWSLKHVTEIRWEGACPGGRAEGRGLLYEDFGEEDKEPSGGAFVKGKRQGRWVEPFRDGFGSEGLYLDGIRHGWSITRWPSGSVTEGSYVRDDKHGWWTEREANGDCARVRYEKHEEKERAAC